MLNFTFEGIAKPLLDSALVNNAVNSSAFRDRLFGSIICIASIVVATYCWRTGYMEDVDVVSANAVKKTVDIPSDYPVLSDFELQAVATNLFGEGRGGSDVMQVKTPPPETALNLLLSAVFYSDDPQEAAAAIGIDGKASKMLQVGEEIMSNVLLKSVGTNTVIIERNGELESLKLGSDDKKGGAYGLTQARNTANTRAASIKPSTLLDRNRTKQNGITQDQQRSDAIKKRLDKLRKGSQ